MQEPHERLRMARERRGYRTASEAARAMHVPIQTYLSHENGQNDLWRSAYKYARFFRVSFEWLLTGDGSPDGNPAAMLYSELPDHVKPFALEMLQGLVDRYKNKQR